MTFFKACFSLGLPELRVRFCPTIFFFLAVAIFRFWVCVFFPQRGSSHFQFFFFFFFWKFCDHLVSVQMNYQISRSSLCRLAVLAIITSLTFSGRNKDWIYKFSPKGMSFHCSWELVIFKRVNVFWNWP